MAKSALKNRAVGLRKQGLSVNKIAQRLSVSKGSASRWVKDVVLSIGQLEKLRNNSILGRERGQVIGAFKQKQARIERQRVAIRDGMKTLSTLTSKELLVAGLAFYSSEGVKAKREVRFCNSDPEIVNFMLKWLRSCFQIKNDDLRCAVGVNEIHRERESELKLHWSTICEIPLSQFRKTSFKKVMNRKIYPNSKDHFGTLDVCVLRSTSTHDKIMGLIKGLFNAKVTQW